MAWQLRDAGIKVCNTLTNGILLICRHQSLEMAWQLRDAGVAHEQLLYKDASHADFATSWHPLSSPQVGTHLSYYSSRHE